MSPPAPTPLNETLAQCVMWGEGGEEGSVSCGGRVMGEEGRVPCGGWWWWWMKGGCHVTHCGGRVVVDEGSVS